ncbi:Cu2+-exporting ATPase [Rhodoligotrophos appendicifer]|uniref:heavy metal translocating P-type ATPase n=1 Tax=Rhodoligotrophos appendicifer TaxID=987056 RepID=UPI001184BE7F|nr:heavy metal translocating P-type ATPase [Rhodoligotrophos appendicifer]
MAGNLSLPALAPAACCAVAPAPLDLGPRVDASFIRVLEPGMAHVDFLVPEMHCAGCMSKIEAALRDRDGVAHARANLTTHRVGVDFAEKDCDADQLLAAIERCGYRARPFDAAALDASAEDKTASRLLTSLAVAGFAAGNVMLLSVSVWSGADGATRDLFHWLSALIALPCIAYAGQPFFRSAYRALKAGTLNMDVPISLGVILASAMSLYETATSGQHAWFDASVGLLFFLLLGRYLDHRMRGIAKSAAAQLLSLSARSAMRLEADGRAAHVPISEIAIDDLIQVAAGERVPIDGRITQGLSEVDRSMLTGEADPERVRVGDRVYAGTLNLTGSLVLRATAVAKDTLLAEIVRLMEAAERGDSDFVRLADRAARLYSPAVHILALATLLGWLALGGGWHESLTAALAVLIITCPCALGLAVPAVQVVASGYLLRRGIMLKDGGALERLAMIDTVVFDKTGTLTRGEPQLVSQPGWSSPAWPVAAALAQASRHPLSRALQAAAAARGIEPAQLTDIVETPGFGLTGRLGGRLARMGRQGFAGPSSSSGGRQPELWVSLEGDAPSVFRFQDQLREDAAATVATLNQAGLDTQLLSGDRRQSVSETASRAGIQDWRAEQTPAEKAAVLTELRHQGRHVLMVGDGINDAPALASAFVSMSPSSAADVSQTAASLLFTTQKLDAVLVAWRTARVARRIIIENFALAIAYNAIAVPIAMAGIATPLIAAIAMSTSSILVTANALRLPLATRRLGRRISELPLLQEAVA